MISTTANRTEVGPSCTAVLTHSPICTPKLHLEELHHAFALVREVSGHRQRHVAADAYEVDGLVLPHDGVDSGVLRLGVVFQPFRNLCQ